ncbi:histidine kinase [Caulobacter sp. DWP3-1-3b2]|uniref:PAS domain-containing sensor histidine kinase n=1 Tax=Caulobacter sp. DWP3-1-3b2 TaxID=2804643 RepID=UPI003CEA1275
MHVVQGIGDASDPALPGSMLDALSSNIAILDSDGRIVAVNEAWAHFVTLSDFDLKNLGLGADYMSLPNALHASDSAAIDEGLRALWGNEPSPFRLEYETGGAVGRYWVRLSAVRVGEGEKPLLIVSHEDITPQRRAQAALGRATAALLHAEDDERRRIARELHDGTAQYLTGANLMLGNQKVEGRAEEIRMEVKSLLTSALDEIRSLSYVLHPPALEELGLGLALRQLIDGFARRTSLSMRIDIADDFPKMNAATEIALYRVAQEALANVHRHSGSSMATISLRLAGEMVLLSIRDYGVGLASEDSLTGGVGLAGMRLRLEFLNGHVTLTQGLPGVLVEAWVPFLAKNAAGA